MLTLAQAQTIVSVALTEGRRLGCNPLAVAVYDARGALKAFAAEDGTSLRRADIAKGKAYGAIALGVGSRTINKMALDRPHFVNAAMHAIGGSLVPVPGGVLIRDSAGVVLGSVGISGDTSDNDEAAAMSGITSIGLTGDPGM